MTAEETRSEAEAEQGASPSVVPAYAIREVPFDAPYSWLAAGWRDMWRVPRVSLAYGAIFAVTGLSSGGRTDAGRPAIADPRSAVGAKTSGRKLRSSVWHLN